MSYEIYDTYDRHISLRIGHDARRVFDLQQYVEDHYTSDGGKDVRKFDPDDVTQIFFKHAPKNWKHACLVRLCVKRKQVPRNGKKRRTFNRRNSLKVENLLQYCLDDELKQDILALFL